MKNLFLSRFMTLGAVIVLGAVMASPVVAAPTWSAAGPGTVNVTDADQGDDGQAQFTYLINPAGFSTRQWTFLATATTTGPVTIDYDWTGFHAFFQVTTGLVAVDGGGETTLIADGPVNCCTPPSGGFSYSGQVTLNTVAGEQYGFKVSGSNFDSNNQLGGTFTINAVGPLAVDDEYGTLEDTALNVPAPGVLGNDVAPIVSAITNGGFETGDSSGWSITIPPGGTAAVVTSQAVGGDCDFTGGTYFPDEGAYFLALKTNGPGSRTIAAQTFSAQAGWLMTGSAAFDYGDYNPFDDNARVEILNDGGVVIATPWAVNGNSVPDYWNGPWTAWNWVAPAAGDYTVRLSVTNDADGVCDSRAHFDNIVMEGPLPLTAVLDTDVSHGALTLNADGSFSYTPDANYCGPDSFTYHANDGTNDSNIASVSIDVECVNDPPTVTSVTPAQQTSDYSDYIGTVTIVATDIDSTSMTLSQTGAPADIPNPDLNTTTDCVTEPNDTAADGSTCTWTMDGQVLVPGDNVYEIVFTANDGELDSSNTLSHVLIVEPENATVTQDAGNDVAIEVAEEGGDSGVFYLYFSAVETLPDLAGIGTPEHGDLNLMVPYMELVPVGPGGPEPGVCYFIEPLPNVADGYGQVAFFECEFDEVPVNTYEVVASVDGATETTRYYAGSDDGGVLVVYDPSLGFTTGGGWFYWPGTADPELTACGEDGYPGDKTNFGYNMKYNKKMTNIQGSLLLQRHTVDENCEGAGKYRVKSNALRGLSIGDATDDTGDYGWAVFSGKSVFNEPNADAEGNHPFVVYVEDHDDQGGDQNPADEFWIKVEDKDGNVVLEVNGPDSDPAGEDGSDGDDTPIENGNIIVPHQ